MGGFEMLSSQTLNRSKHSYSFCYKPAFYIEHRVLLLNLAEIKQHESEISELYNQIVRKQIVRLGVLNGLYFMEMKRQLKDKYKINFPDQVFKELLDTISNQSLQAMAIRVRQFFGEEKEMGLKMN